MHVKSLAEHLLAFQELLELTKENFLVSLLGKGRQARRASMVAMSLLETLVGRPLVWTVKGVTVLTAAVTSPLWVPLVFFSTVAAGFCLVPAATLVVFGYFLWKAYEWKQTLDTIRGVLRAIRNELFPRPGLLHPEDTGPPKEPVDGPGTAEPEPTPPQAKPPKVLAETPGHEEVTRAYIRPYSPVKEAVKETQPKQPQRQEEEALVKRPVLTVQESKTAAPKHPAVDKNQVLQDVYFLEEFVGVKDPGAPPPPGDIEQQINEIAKVVVGAPIPVQWPSNEDEKYVVAATQVLPALRDFIGV
ncbi:hypothetical protein KFL_003110090 [Klebsormidium nitens]|uniref:Uncharacterized protein n=1 Tax=Klebsormidium nitens TaxID=105231 RepID=A0A1Y1IDI9_KLENI|nr:hypothetical protein KFL_003110090 [Klebsormidium nitens]|eukprot:GAQ86787.1 hypothetical protein KFL_003110090 [Klebsormidium nitens]